GLPGGLAQQGNDDRPAVAGRALGGTQWNAYQSIAAIYAPTHTYMPSCFAIACNGVVRVPLRSSSEDFAIVFALRFVVRGADSQPFVVAMPLGVDAAVRGANVRRSGGDVAAECLLGAGLVAAVLLAPLAPFVVQRPDRHLGAGLHHAPLAQEGADGA